MPVSARSGERLRVTLANCNAFNSIMSDPAIKQVPTWGYLTPGILELHCPSRGCFPIHDVCAIRLSGPPLFIPPNNGILFKSVLVGFGLWLSGLG